MNSQTMKRIKSKQRRSARSFPSHARIAPLIIKSLIIELRSMPPPTIPALTPHKRQRAVLMRSTLPTRYAILVRSTVQLRLAEFALLRIALAPILRKVVLLPFPCIILLFDIFLILQQIKFCDGVLDAR